jgi:3-phosphoinositide dependent protein kinase-1
LLDDKYHIKITDFGTSRILDDPIVDNGTKEMPVSEGKPVRRRNSFVGTAQFVAPEVLQGKLANVGCDLWALGCIIYQMLTGEHLFTGG